MNQRLSVLAPITSLALCLALPVRAIPGPAPQQAAPATPPKATAQQPASPLGAKFREAQDKIEQGDLEGAIRLLEEMRRDPKVPRVMIATLGALYLKVGKAQQALDVLKPLAEGETPDPAVLYNAGRAALALGQAEQGQKYLELSATLEPLSPAARELGFLLARQGRNAAAYRVLRPWALARTQDVEARLAAAALALELAATADAEQLLSGLPQDRPRVRLLAGRLQVQKGDPAGAIATLQPLLEKPQPEIDLDVRRALARAHLAAGKPAEAVKLLQGKGGEDPATALLLGQAQQQGGSVQEALATLKPWADQLLKAGGRVADQDLAAEVALGYGRMLAAAGRPQEGVEALALATRLQPQSAEAWQAHGEALAAAGRRDEGEKALARSRELAAAEAKQKEQQQAAAQAPEVSPHLKETLALLEKNQLDPALVSLRKEIERAPGDLFPRTLEVRILLAMKRPKEALAAAEKTLAAFPGQSDAIYQRGVAKMANQQLQGAEADFRQTLKVAPGHVPAMNDLAVLLMVRGEKAEARTLLEAVLKARPGDEVAAGNLRKLKAGGGKKEGGTRP